ncbi:MAG: nucleotidyltransferase family protein [Bryobacteraceae bacterium]
MGKVLYQKQGDVDILELRRVILANLPDPDYIGHRAYWATPQALISEGGWLGDNSHWGLPRSGLGEWADDHWTTEIDGGRLAELCRRYGVRELSVFGSAARGQARPDSDIDLLVDFLPQAETGLLDYAGLMLELEALLGRKVDLVSRNGLKPLIRAAVIEDACCLYAA